MPFELETRPLAACPRCRRRVAPPLGPSYVYGIGAIGFQHCPACGARWRCLWAQPRARRRGPLRSAALVAAAVLVVGAGAAAYANSRSSKQPELASARHGDAPAIPRATAPGAAGARYVSVVASANAAKAELMQFVETAPPVTPSSELDRHAARYAAAERRADAALSATVWPARAAPAVRQLVTADRVLTGDFELGITFLNQPWFGDKVDADAGAVRSSAAHVRAALGLPAGRAVPDPRFPQL